MMSLKPSSKSYHTVMLGLCFLAYLISVAAQEKTKKPPTISTESKLVIGKLKVSDDETFEVRGQATFTITAANSDDTIGGTLVYTVPEEARQKIAESLGKPRPGKQPTIIPLSDSIKDTIASFEKNTACPEIHLEFVPMDIDILGVKVHLDRFILNLNPTEPTTLSKLFCKWVDHINGRLRGRNGAAARINAILQGDEIEDK